MKNRGFTLIELLAILVILAIIAIIAVPNILNALEDSRKGHAKVSALGYIEAIEDNNKLVGTDPSIKEISGYDLDIDDIDIKIKGTKPETGMIDIDEDGLVSYADFCINDYRVIYNQEEVTVAKSPKCKVLTPGLWDSKEGILLASWSDLVNSYNLNIEKDYEDYFDADGQYVLDFEIDHGNAGNSLYYVVNTYFPSYGGSRYGINSSKELSLVIPNGITKIGDSALFWVYNLSSLKLPDSVTSVGKFSVSQNKLRKIEVSKNLVEIGYGAFEDTKLKEFQLSDDITKIEKRVFYNSMLRSIIVPNNVTYIGSDAFTSTYLKKITIPANVSEIGLPSWGSAFGGYIEKITVDSNNKNFVVVDGVLYDKDKTMIYAYEINSSRKKITIPASVEYIAFGAFTHSNLEQVVFEDPNNWYENIVGHNDPIDFSDPAVSATYLKTATSGEPTTISLSKTN